MCHETIKNKFKANRVGRTIYWILYMRRVHCNHVIDYCYFVIFSFHVSAGIVIIRNIPAVQNVTRILFSLV